MKPGDQLLDGTYLRSTKCAGRQDAVIYTSRTVECEYIGAVFTATSARLPTPRRYHRFDMPGSNFTLNHKSSRAAGEGRWCCSVGRNRI